MINISVSRNEKGYITAIEAAGHSGYAAEGEDIVCAVVSTALQSVVLCCEEVVKCSCFADIKDGYLKWSLNDKKAAASLNILTETLFRVLKQAEEEYSSYISLKEVIK